MSEQNSRRFKPNDIREGQPPNTSTGGISGRQHGELILRAEQYAMEQKAANRILQDGKQIQKITEWLKQQKSPVFSPAELAKAAQAGIDLPAFQEAQREVSAHMLHRQESQTTITDLVNQRTRYWTQQGYTDNSTIINHILQNELREPQRQQYYQEQKQDQISQQASTSRTDMSSSSYGEHTEPTSSRKSNIMDIKSLLNKGRPGRVSPEQYSSSNEGDQVSVTADIQVTGSSQPREVAKRVATIQASNAITSEALATTRRNKTRQARRDAGEENVSEDEILDKTAAKRVAAIQASSAKRSEALATTRRNKTRQARRDAGEENVSEDEILDKTAAKRVAAIQASSAKRSEARATTRRNKTRQARRDAGEENVSEDEILDKTAEKRLASAQASDKRTSEALATTRRNKTRQARRDAGEENVSEDEILDKTAAKRLATIQARDKRTSEALATTRRNKTRQERRDAGEENVSEDEILDKTAAKRVAAIQANDKRKSEAQAKKAEAEAAQYEQVLTFEEPGPSSYPS